MPKTTPPPPSTPETLRQRTKQQADLNGENWKQQEIVRRMASGKQNCPRRLGGYNYDEDICQACRDHVDCKHDSAKQLQATAYQLGKLGYEYDPEYWIADNLDDLDIDAEREHIIEFALGLREAIKDEPELVSKIKALPSITIRLLNQHVLEWSQFHREVKTMKPRLVPERALSRLEDILNEARERVLDATEIDDPQEAWEGLLSEPSHAKSRLAILTSIYKQLQDYADAFHNTFKVRRQDKPTWPTGWMENDKTIRQMMKRCKHFAPLMNYLCDHRLNLKESREAMKRHNIESHDGRDLIMLPKLDFARMQEELNLSADPLRKYLRELVRIEALKKFGKDGPNGQCVYAVGYWLPVPDSDQTKPVYFLTQKRKDKLKGFAPYPTRSQ